MSEDLIVGIVTGLGWGAFLAFPLGCMFIIYLLNEVTDDEEPGDGTPDE